MKAVFVLLAFFVSCFAHGELKFNSLFCDNAVLQRDMPVSIFGTSEPSEKITVEFANQSVVCKADASGNWLAVLAPMKADCRGKTLAAKSAGGKKIAISNVLVGDVWLCGGQSNMATPIAHHSLLTKIEKERDYSNENLRLFTVATPRSKKPESFYKLRENAETKKGWQLASYKSINNFGATGFYFGKHLQQDTGVPVGMVMSAVGATRIQSWLPRSESKHLTKKDIMTSGNFPAYALHDTMIYPLRNYTFKGIVWWQGESNSMWAQRYEELFYSLITSWRKEFKRPDIPFINVLLSTFRPVDGDVTGRAWAYLKQAQINAIKKCQNAHLVSSFDIGEIGDIHPQQKELIGERLAKLAQSIDAKKPLVSPEVDKVLFNGNVAEVVFKNTKQLSTKPLTINRTKGAMFGQDKDALIVPADTVSGFELCGSDNVFYDAKARIAGNKVVVECDRVLKPVAVRYMFKTTALGNLYGENGLPALPFKSDNLPMPDFFGNAVAKDANSVDLKDFAKFAPVLKHGEGSIDEIRDENGTLYRSAKRTKTLGMMYFNAPMQFKNSPTGTYEITVVYKDSMDCIVNVLYDSADASFLASKHAPKGAFKKLGTFEMSGTGKNKEVSFKVKDLRFENKNNGCDLRFDWLQNADLEIYGVYIKKVAD